MPTFAILLLTVQIVFLAVFAFLCDYDDDGSSGKYAMFQDLQVMIFVGFGFLMTFLKKYTYSALGYNFLLSALVVQGSMILRGLVDVEDGRMKMGIKSLIRGELTCACVLISFGAVLGRAGPVQLVVMACLQVCFQQANQHINANILGAVDTGGSMFVHMFGAYFGLAVASKIGQKQANCSTKNEDSSYHSDIFAMIGTLFLWMFWPSFNAALAPTSSQPRIIINSYLALAASCVTTFATTALVEKNAKLKMVYVQNGTLAGGVAVGAVCDMIIQPYGALVLGSAAGIVSTLGYRYLSPWLSRYGIKDTCGVHNLHGLPGIEAAVAAAVASAFATEREYGRSLNVVFPHRNIHAGTDEDENGWTVSVWEQVLHQTVALVLTLVIALSSGTFVGEYLTCIVLSAAIGLLIRQKIFAPLHEDLFSDRPYWQLPPDNKPSMEIMVLDSSPYKAVKMNPTRAKNSVRPYLNEETDYKYGGQKYLTVNVVEDRILVHQLPNNSELKRDGNLLQTESHL